MDGIVVEDVVIVTGGGMMVSKVISRQGSTSVVSSMSRLCTSMVVISGGRGLSLLIESPPLDDELMSIGVVEMVSIDGAVTGVSPLMIGRWIRFAFGRNGLRLSSWMTYFLFSLNSSYRGRGCALGLLVLPNPCAPLSEGGNDVDVSRYGVFARSKINWAIRSFALMTKGDVVLFLSITFISPR